MKLTKADFRCSFFDESCDLDQDVIDQCLRDQKLRELIELHIKSEIQNGKKITRLERLQELLEESKKN